MKTVTVKLSPEVDSVLEAVSARRHISKSAVLREALQKELLRDESEPTFFDLVQESVGRIESKVRARATKPKHIKSHRRQGQG
jgi:Arc/MetJ-type ribon-helix-helix transcriptional regulator